MREFKVRNWVATIFAVMVLTACGLCEEKQLSKLSSPGGGYVAAVYQRNCGSFSHLIYHVNIRRQWSWFSSDNRGVIEDGQVFLSSTGKINISWKDEKTLAVECEGCDKDKNPIIQSSWGDVSISYQLH